MTAKRSWRRRIEVARARLVLAVLAAAVVAAAAAPRGLVAQGSASVEGEGDGPGLTGYWAFKWTDLYEDGAWLAGGGIGWSLDDATRVGVAGYGTASPSTYGRDLDFEIAYGGAWLERDLARNRHVSVGASLLVGGGSFGTVDRRTEVESRTGVGLVEPELILATPGTGRWQLAAGVGWRFVWGVEGDLGNRSDGDARGPVLTFRMQLR